MKPGQAPALRIQHHVGVEVVLAALANDADRPIALICARGHRSAYARELLQQSGFGRVHDIAEGMIGGVYGPGWLARALPTEPWQS